jgi:hypothetical protein
MPPSLALGICWVVIIWLFYQDQRKRPHCSNALWIPVLWLLMLGSHPLSFWLGITSAESDLEGNSFDRMVYGTMIIVSIALVARRGLVLSRLIQCQPGHLPVLSLSGGHHSLGRLSFRDLQALDQGNRGRFRFAGHPHRKRTVGGD